MENTEQETPKKPRNENINCFVLLITFALSVLLYVGAIMLFGEDGVRLLFDRVVFVLFIMFILNNFVPKAK